MAGDSVHQLGLLPIFEGTSRRDLEHISTLAGSRVMPANSYIVTASTPGESVFFIHSGTVKIKIDRADGNEVIIAVLGAGSIIGELSVLDSGARSADALTLEETHVIWFDKASFAHILYDVQPVARNLFAILSRRLRLSTEQIQALCTLDVMGRVARQLLAFADLYGESVDAGVLIPMRLTQSDIASLVGATRERVNQSLSGMRDQMLIAIDGSNRITIVDDARLRALLARR